VLWQHVLGVACVVCAVQNGTEWRVWCVLCRMHGATIKVSVPPTFICTAVNKENDLD
jgi:hypothetical protein